MDAITRHIDAARARRVGGILVGRSRNSSVAIQAAVPAARVEEHRGEVVFLPEVWEQAYDIMLERYPGSRIVGWYHSHPGTGSQFSDYDRRLHSVLFSEAPSVALVVDPLARRAAWYGWVLGRIAPVDQPEKPVPVSHPSKGNRAAVAAALALGVAAAAAAGYWIGRDRIQIRTEVVSGQLRTKLEAEQDRARELTRRLEAARVEKRQLAAREAAQRAELESVRRKLSAAEQAAKASRLVVRYHVRPGDSLWDLAERFYGHGRAWKRIYRANRQRPGGPCLLFPGQTILIPLP